MMQQTQEVAVTNLDQFADDLTVGMVAESLVGLINYEALDGVGRADAATQVVGDHLRSEVKDTLVSPRTTPLRRLHRTWTDRQTPV